MTGLETADKVIADILAHGGKDYSAARQEIADLFDETLWNGNWDATTDFNPGLPNLRFIQEDEYDQHMDDERPSKKMICYSCGHYVFPA
jgi:hypothetical protein